MNGENTGRFVIEADNLVKVFGKGAARVEALKGVSLAVRPGELFAIMGPSGSGKTTLLTILGLVSEPTEGHVVLDGEDIYRGGRQDLQRLRREKIGFIFQFANLIPFLSARENVMLPLDLVGIRGRQASSRALELLDYLGIAHRSEHRPDQLSGGEKQRVAIARALANEPKMLLADEPTAALDTERGLSVMRLLRKLSTDRQTAILVVTHDTRMVTEVDSVIHVLDGQIVERSADVHSGGPLAGTPARPT